jgi:hypothetical protein
VPRELRTSLTQLEAWCIALRDAKLSLTIRHVNCDALAFCHVLRHQRVNNTHLTSHWYRRCQKFGRLGVKGSIALMHTHIFGFQGQEKTSLFSFYTASGQIARIFVNVVRFDVSNQTVFRDAAIIPSYPKISTEVDWIVLSTMRGQKIVTLVVDDMEIPFWHHLLPTFVERCRSWTHKSTCEYKAKGRNIPLSTKLDEQLMCTCGMGVFPDNCLKNLQQLKALRKVTVRAAILVIYASPISPGTLGPALKSSAKSKSSKPAALPKVQTPAPPLEDLDAKKGACFACGAKKAEKGGDLLKCGGCRFVDYCSKEYRAVIGTCPTSSFANS